MNKTELLNKLAQDGRSASFWPDAGPDGRRPAEKTSLPTPVFSPPPSGCGWRPSSPPPDSPPTSFSADIRGPSAPYASFSRLADV